MLKILKVGNLVYENIGIKEIDEEGNIVDNPVIPKDFAQLKNCALDTIRWQAGQKLQSTDWVVTKIYEAQVTGGDVEVLKTKYTDILAQRESIRALSNSKEDTVNNYSTYEELLETCKDLTL